MVVGSFESGHKGLRSHALFIRSLALPFCLRTTLAFLLLLSSFAEVLSWQKTTKKKDSDLEERLERYRQIKLTVIGRKSGQEISNPVWFVFEGEKLYLLPVRGSDTQWYRNILKNPSIKIDARGERAKFLAVPIQKPQSVKSVVDKFREKYGAGDVKKYYSKFDVAVLARPA
jgi:deazaflavin-dependent oxidoreductase (nitroreductase family)